MARGDPNTNAEFVATDLSNAPVNFDKFRSKIITLITNIKKRKGKLMTFTPDTVWGANIIVSDLLNNLTELDGDNKDKTKVKNLCLSTNYRNTETKDLVDELLRQLGSFLEYLHAIPTGEQNLPRKQRPNIDRAEIYRSAILSNLDKLTPFLDSLAKLLIDPENIPQREKPQIKSARKPSTWEKLKTAIGL